MYANLSYTVIIILTDEGFFNVPLGGAVSFGLLRTHKRKSCSDAIRNVRKRPAKPFFRCAPLWNARAEHNWFARWIFFCAPRSRQGRFRLSNKFTAANRVSCDGCCSALLGLFIKTQAINLKLDKLRRSAHSFLSSSCVDAADAATAPSVLTETQWPSSTSISCTARDALDPRWSNALFVVWEEEFIVTQLHLVISWPHASLSISKIAT